MLVTVTTKAKSLQYDSKQDEDTAVGRGCLVLAATDAATYSTTAANAPPAEW